MNPTLYFKMAVGFCVIMFLIVVCTRAGVALLLQDEWENDGARLICAGSALAVLPASIPIIIVQFRRGYRAGER